MKNLHTETELYEPIKQLLEAQGFTVKGEVKGCDVAAVKDGALWVVEMKLHFNITVLYQAMERQKITESVFIATPRPRRANEKNHRLMMKLLKKMELGLITVALDSPIRFAEIILFPGGAAAANGATASSGAAVSRKKPAQNKKASALIRTEIEGRIGDTAGGTNAAVNTAYRERCIRVACLLSVHGPLTAKLLVNKFGCEKDAGGILRGNFYGWFEKRGPGLYALTPVGAEYLNANKNAVTVAYYRIKAEDTR
ncbi:MAG: DUF2161 family putative PD-(D/E)XK-type phosphodiesterase [Clostridiales bacterium]|jgi:hypothetical protein|nr:DUF2161 family putative PD-(D/E)XK-type phosphodiesterase [Clostridiales bacterium]